MLIRSLKIMKFLCILILATTLSSKLTAGIYASPEFGFSALFPSKAEAIPVKNSVGDAIVITSRVFEEEPLKLIMFQIIAHRVAVMKGLPKTEGKKNLDLVQNNLDVFVKTGGGAKYTSKISETPAWPAVEFFCQHEGFFREGIISYKRGIAFLEGDVYYKVIAHSIEDNQELKDSILALYASFTFVEPKFLELMDSQK